MRSLELACLIIALVVFADVGFLLLSNNSASNLRSLAKILAHEIKHAEGLKVLNIGIHALVILQDDKLVIKYGNVYEEVSLKDIGRKLIHSSDSGPIVVIYANKTHIWLGTAYTASKKGNVHVSVRLPPVLLYTIVPNVEYKLFESSIIMEDVSLRLDWHSGSIRSWLSQNEYSELNFDLTIEVHYPNYGLGLWHLMGAYLNVEYGGKIVSVLFYRKYGHRCYVRWCYRDYYVGDSGYRGLVRTFKLTCRNGVLRLEGYPGSIPLTSSTPSKVKIWLSDYYSAYPMEVYVSGKVWTGYSKWSSPKKLELMLGPQGFIGTIELNDDVSALAFSIKPSRLIVGDSIVANFKYDNGWWVCDISGHEGSCTCTIYFDARLKEVYGSIIDNHYEYYITLDERAPVLISVLVPKGYDVIAYLDNAKLVPKDVYEYNMTYNVYMYNIVKNEAIKVLIG